MSYWLWLLIYCNIWSTSANFIIFISSRELLHILTHCSCLCLLFDSSLIMQNQHSVMWKGMWSLSWLTFPLGCSFDIEQCGGFSSSPASVLMRQLNPWCRGTEGWERGKKGSMLSQQKWPRAPIKFHLNADMELRWVPHSLVTCPMKYLNWILLEIPIHPVDCGVLFFFVCEINRVFALRFGC